MAQTIILYHKNCDDGFGAAWAAWKKFGKRAEYIGSAPWEEPPSSLTGKDVYLLDFCYVPHHIKKLLKITKSLTVVDHHVSSKEAIALVSNHVFNSDFTHSGAMLSWKYFHSAKKAPLLLRVIEDIDIWKWKVPYSRELSDSLRVYDRSFNTWSRLAHEWEFSESRKKYIIEGNAIMKDHEDRVQEAVEDAERVTFCGYKTLASNSRMLVDYIGAALYKKLPPLGIIWSERSGKIVVSLRSNGKVDVSKLAKKFGGGGHKTASAFRLPLGSKLPWKLIKK